MGPAETPDGPSTDIKTLVWDKPEISATSPLGLVLWTAIRASRSVRCAAKLNAQQCIPSWDFFATMWVKILCGWEALPECTLPGAETKLLMQALTAVQQTSVLHHPRVTVSGSRTPPSSGAHPENGNENSTK